MNARYPGAQLYFPMGSDMLLWFRNWAAYRELLRLSLIHIFRRHPLGAGRDKRQAAARRRQDGERHFRRHAAARRHGPVSYTHLDVYKRQTLGRVINELMLEQFPNIVDVKFSAHMEEELDLSLIHI